MTQIDLANVRPASVKHIKTPNRIELSVDLGFGVHVNRVFLLADVRIDDIPQEHRQAAVHCLVVLIGGKSVLVEPEHLRENCRFARIFLTSRVYGHPVGLVLESPIFDRPVLDVGMFYQWLAGRDYDVAEVRSILTRGGG
tara:strand:- start:1866 stop:2285 length:420 start_codon:yes stop_codon:yes gene_type:complete